MPLDESDLVQLQSLPPTMECAMTCFISIRACPVPNDFFDELIPEEGLEAQGWRIFVQRISTPTNSIEKPDTFVSVRWLYAEFDCESQQVKEVLKVQLPELKQILRILAGMRQTYFMESVRFSMYFEEYVHNGVRGNIHPIHIPVGLTIQNFQTKDEAGNTLFDAKIFEAEQAEKRRLAAKNDLKIQASRNLKFLSDPHFRRAWESYSLAMGSDEHAIGHLYDVRESASEKFADARKVLGFSKNQWRDFGLLFNDNPVYGGRHNGKHPHPLRPMSDREKSEALKFTHRLLEAFASQLESEEPKQS
jgi:hypothetical protein